MSLQEGIYYADDDQPVCFGLLLANLAPGCTAPDARRALERFWELLRELREDGVVRDLRPQREGDPPIHVERQGLTTLLGFGPRLFDPAVHAQPWLDRELRPPELVRLRGGARSPFPKLPWADGAAPEASQCDVALQLIADREITINRVVVETSKLIADESLPIELVAYHRGFRRDDGRSWIDFGDGTNNMSPERRLLALEVTSADPAWMLGGSFMLFLRIAIDLPAWRALSRAQQEVVVGRQKLTGCPIATVQRTPDRALHPLPRAPCPPPAGASARDLAAFRDPPRATDPLVQTSHIHRSNFNRGDPDTDANNRIYRQGYEFMELLPGGSLDLGLNFVSFQRTISRVRNILHMEGWQGDTNFGGPEPPGPGDPIIELMQVRAGGYYAVPAGATPFPGAGLFA